MVVAMIIKPFTEDDERREVSCARISWLGYVITLAASSLVTIIV